MSRATKPMPKTIVSASQPAMSTMRSPKTQPMIKAVAVPKEMQQTIVL